jgi:hypothetical protein
MSALGAEERHLVINGEMALPALVRIVPWAAALDAHELAVACSIPLVPVIPMSTVFTPGGATDRCGGRG